MWHVAPSLLPRLARSRSLLHPRLTDLSLHAFPSCRASLSHMLARSRFFLALSHPHFALVCKQTRTQAREEASACWRSCFLVFCRACLLTCSFARLLARSCESHNVGSQKGMPPRCFLQIDTRCSDAVETWGTCQ